MKQKRVKESLRIHPVVMQLVQAIADREKVSRSFVMEALMVEALKSRSLIESDWAAVDGRGGDRRSAVHRKRRKDKQQQNVD